ncbi:MAG: hypothetical protein KVP17_002311 [Porospora cf. gigantea B]|uniref:uncharacterized protein n=1 Tax=Porospora cf. gigantea B TaxID=2853592 RepID=UPI00357193A4|nr:MAG: hypothetical protein KVP17_002311 [Porospora cf. gigantea B]
MFSPDPDLDMISGRRCTHNVPDGPFPPPPALQIPSFCHNTSLGSDDSSPALKVVPAVESLEDCYKSCAQAASISCAYFSYDPSIKDCQLLRRTNKSIAAEVTVSMMCALNTTTTTIPPLPFIADPACYMELTNMVHADAGVVRNVPNVEECLRSCWWDPHCVAFGYLKEPKDCWMRYAIVATTTLDGLVSGVLSCFAKAALLSQAPPVPLPTHSDPGNPSLLRCLKYNVSLMPPPHSEWTFYTNTKKTTADDVEGCIRNCVEDRGAFCSLVNFDTSTSQCTLLRAAGGQKYDPNTVSVDLGCLYPKHYQPWRYAGSTRHFDPT